MSADPLDDLVSGFLGRHPRDAARTLEGLGVETAATVLAAAPRELAAATAREMQPGVLAECLLLMPPASAGAIVGALPSTTAAALLLSIRPEERASLLDATPPDRAREISKRLRFSAGAVGLLVETSNNAFPASVTASEARERMSVIHGPYLYVIDGSWKLLGVVHLRDLEREPARQLGQLMTRELVALPAFTSIETALAHPGWRDFDVLPVVDDQDTFIGTIRHKKLRQAELSDRSSSGATSGFDTFVSFGEAYWSSLWEVVGAVAEMDDKDESRGGERS